MKKTQGSFLADLNKKDKRKESKKSFDWSKPVATKKNSTLDLKTPQRLNRFREVKPSDISTVDELREHITDRRKKRAF